MAKKKPSHGMTDDEIDAEIAYLLEDPELRADLERADKEIDSGNFIGIPHEEVGRILGLKTTLQPDKKDQIV